MRCTCSDIPRPRSSRSADRSIPRSGVPGQGLQRFKSAYHTYSVGPQRGYDECGMSCHYGLSTAMAWASQNLGKGMGTQRQVAAK